MHLRSAPRRLLPAAVLVAVVWAAPHAQFLNEVLGHRLNDAPASELFGCTNACVLGTPEQPCNLWNRVYGDKAPSAGINDPLLGAVSACESDGYPRYGSVRMAWFGDGHITANYDTINQAQDACEGWYSIWDGVTHPGLGTFVTYYAAASTIVNQGENGYASCPDCSSSCGSSVPSAFACLAPLSAATAEGTSCPGTPLGTVPPIGGLAPVPIVRLVEMDPARGTLSLAWPGATNQATTNRASSTATPCPIGATFDDLTAANGPQPVRAVRLFVHAAESIGSPRSLVSLEGGGLIGSVVDFMGNNRYAVCFDAQTCPGSHIVPCSVVLGGQCHANGIDFLPVEQTITASRCALDAILGPDGPIGTSAENDELVFNTKVVYAGSVETASTAGLARLDPRLVSLFSSNSVMMSFGDNPPAIQVRRDGVRLVGDHLILSWIASGPFSQFRVGRSVDGAAFAPVRLLPALASGRYRILDNVRGLIGPVTYRIIGDQTPGCELSRESTQVSLTARPER